jgi:nucleoside-diphosphate-sugar epimerase
VDECQAVVHCAGAVRGSSIERFRQVNTDGTRRLLEACSGRPGSVRFLHISTLAAREPQLSWYAQSKREAEDLVTASPGDWCILRPPAVYGPGDEEMKAIFDAMRRGIAPVPGDPAARNSLIHVSDLVAAMRACLEDEGARGRILTLCDGKDNGYDWEELAAVAAAVFQRRVRLVRLPRSLLDSVAAVNLFLARLTGRAPMLTPRKLNELRFPNWVVDNEEISACTGWAPRIGLRQGLAELAASAL